MPTEDQEQAVLVDWLRWNRILFHHSPNGGKRNIVTAARLKRLGTSAGFPDIMIFDQSYCSAPGVAIELKRRRHGKTSSSQEYWLKELERRGWIVKVCKGADEAISFLKGLGYGKN